MKKGTLVVALVVVFTLAVAGTAFASWADSGYTSWKNEASAATGAGTSPHYGFVTTTKNCSVCHAVHNATAGGQLLLPTSVANSCNYCHIDTGNTESTKKVYGGSQANYTVDIRGNHSGGGSFNSKCSDCHSVHSANTVANGSKILKLASSYAGTYQSAPTIGGGSAPTALDITKWCSGCHPYYNTGYNGTSHVMKTEGAYGGAGRTFTGDITVFDSELCTRCHNTTVAQGFPHYAPTHPRFLSDGITSTTNPAVANNDGPCLRCHTTVGSMY